jgi:hypothetical protein
MQKKNKKSLRFARGANLRAGHLMHPPQMRANLEVKHQYRFVSSSGTPTTITDSTLLTACGCLASTAILGRAIFQAVKVNRIEVWTPPASVGAAATCSIFWTPTTGGIFGMSREVSDTTVSVSEPAHVISTPPKETLAGYYQIGLGNSLFTLVAPPGSLIDVWVSLVVIDGAMTNATTSTLVGATIGGVYYSSLDSSTKAGSLYTSVSLTSL